MKKTTKIILLLFIIGMVTLANTYSLADVGSFDRYDSGGSDWSSSDWSSSDWSSSSWDYDDDYSYSSYGSSYSSGGSFWIIIIIVVIVIIVLKNKNNIRPPYANQYRNIDTTSTDLEQSHRIARLIQQTDTSFSEEKMLSFSKDLFVKLQNAWTARDWEPMRPFESRELFEQHLAQIKGYIDTNKINVVDRIAVNYAYLDRFAQQGDKEILEVKLKATMKDYIIDATTKELLEGSKTEDRGNVYKLTFERKLGVKTQGESNEIKTTNCPNCGAPTKITSSGKCEYCGSIITTGDYGWVLAGLQPYNKN